MSTQSAASRRWNRSSAACLQQTQQVRSHCCCCATKANTPTIAHQMALAVRALCCELCVWRLQSCISRRTSRDFHAISCAKRLRSHLCCVRWSTSPSLFAQMPCCSQAVSLRQLAPIARHVRQPHVNHIGLLCLTIACSGSAV